MSDIPGSTTSAKKPPRKASADRQTQMRLAAAILLTALVTVFAVVNLDKVEVNWIVGTWNTPLILVIVLSAILGAIADRVVQLVMARRGRKPR